MIEQLTQFVKEQAGSIIQNNDQIPADKKEQAAQAASSSVTEVVQQHAASGNSAHVSEALQGGDNSSIVDQITSTLSQKLSGLGIGSGAAASIVPSILEKLKNGGFNFQEMFDKLKGLDGEFQLSDLKNIGDVFSNDDRSAESSTGKKDDSGVDDKLKGLF